MAHVVRFRTRKDTAQRAALAGAAESLRQLTPDELALLPGTARRAISRAVHSLDWHSSADTVEGDDFGAFTMISRKRTAEIWEAIGELPAKERPGQVRDAFMQLMLNARKDTGECVLTREEIAEKIGCRPNNVSSIMSTLERMGVLRRDILRSEARRNGSVVTYVLNADVAWNGSHDARREAAAEFGKAHLKLVRDDPAPDDAEPLQPVT